MSLRNTLNSLKLYNFEEQTLIDMVNVLNEEYINLQAENASDEDIEKISKYQLSKNELNDIFT